ncbi:MAG: MATE family efflux transporter, partial [Eubacterium sp.]|nr:MATE family efflux transporter [Eubacterium sp.]
PLGVMANMTFQSSGRAALAVISSMFRSGLFFIPVIIIGATCFGILGIQCAQPVSDILTFIVVLPMTIHFMHTLPKDRETDM